MFSGASYPPNIVISADPPVDSPVIDTIDVPDIEGSPKTSAANTTFAPKTITPLALSKPLMAFNFKNGLDISAPTPQIPSSLNSDIESAAYVSHLSSSIDDNPLSDPEPPLSVTHHRWRFQSVTIPYRPPISPAGNEDSSASDITPSHAFRRRRNRTIESASAALFSGRASNHNESSASDVIPTHTRHRRRSTTPQPEVVELDEEIERPGETEHLGENIEYLKNRALTAIHDATHLACFCGKFQTFRPSCYKLIIDIADGQGTTETPDTSRVFSLTQLTQYWRDLLSPCHNLPSHQDFPLDTPSLVDRSTSSSDYQNLP